jgi:hypothetical protein
MAIENLSIAHSDLEIRGGLQYVGLMLRGDLGDVTFDVAADDHSVALASNDVFQLFDLKQGTGSLSTAGTKEGGTIMFEHTVSFYVPSISTIHLSNLETLLNENLVVYCQDYNGGKYVLGVSEAYALEDSTVGNIQMYARVSSIEGGTGAALGDENGVTVTITCSAGELPRVCSSTMTLDTSGGTATVA